MFRWKTAKGLFLPLIFCLVFCGWFLSQKNCGGGGGGGGTEYVKVKVCEETALLPNEYCPTIVEKEFKKGEEPTAVCSVHKKPEPPPLKAKVFVSAYDLLAGVGDKIKFLDAVADTGATGVRVFLCSNWNREWPQPWKAVARWNAGYDIAPDALPMYDLTLDDPDYWQSFRTTFTHAKEKNLTIQAVLEDRTAFGAGPAKYRNPFCSNVQDRDPSDHTVNRLPGGVWGIGPDTIEPWHTTWIHRVVQELEEIGVEFYVEITNEYDALDWDAAHMIEWHGKRVDDVKNTGVASQKIMASAVREGKAIAAQVGVYSIHGFVKPGDIAQSYLELLGVENNRIYLSGDGGFGGDGRPDAKGRRGASADQAAEIGRRIIALGYWGYEILDRGLYAQNNDVGNYDAWDSGPTVAIVRALRGL